MKINKVLPFLAVAISASFVISCGTSKRSIESRPSPRKASPVLTLDSTYTLQSPDSLASKHARVLVFKGDKNAEKVTLVEEGRASWYGPKFNGKLTANGEKYDMYGMTAAHRTLPFNTLVLVRDLDSGKSALVRINDRGPFAKNRIIDLSKKAAQKLGMIGHGTANVQLYVAKNAFQKSKKSHLKTPTYTLQLGSFESKAKAFTYASSIGGSRVEIIRRKRKLIYRVYYGLYLKKGEAAKQLRKLERKNHPGYIKQLENG